MKIIKSGHGNSVPRIGQSFFLKIGLYDGRAKFAPALLHSEFGQTRIYYRVRSSAILPREFALGQIWEIEVVRLRASQKMINGGWVSIIWVTVDLIDLYERIGKYFDINTMSWITVKIYKDGGEIETDRTSASVRYMKYFVEVPDVKGIIIKTGHFPEIIENANGKILSRHQPTLRKCTFEPACEKLPNDGVVLSSVGPLSTTWFVEKIDSGGR